MSARPRIVGDVSQLPPVGWGSKSVWYWATVGFMLIEGMGFVLALGSYVYLMSLAPERWPLNSPPPNLWAGTLQTVLMLASIGPTFVLAPAARAMQPRQTRIWAVVLCLLEIGTLAVRGFEFANLNTRWDMDAYGSIVWALMLLHTTHLITDGIGTIVMTIFLFTHPLSEERFSDANDDCLYGGFVVLAWLPIYLAVYWAPRLIS